MVKIPLLLLALAGTCVLVHSFWGGTNEGNFGEDELHLNELVEAHQLAKVQRDALNTLHEEAEKNMKATAQAIEELRRSPKAQLTTANNGMKRAIEMLTKNINWS